MIQISYVLFFKVFLCTIILMFPYAHLNVWLCRDDTRKIQDLSVVRIWLCGIENLCTRMFMFYLFYILLK